MSAAAHRTPTPKLLAAASVLLLSAILASASLAAQTAAAQLPPLPSPLGVPHPAPATDAPYAPNAIVPGGIVVPLYPPGSPYLDMKRVREPELYNMNQTVPGRIDNIVNIHNPSIEVHRAAGGINTGSAVILLPGGGHRFLNVSSEGADFVAFFANYGVNTVIVRNRLRSDGYTPQIEGVEDAQQAIRLVRAYAPQWQIDPHRIGIMGFSAGGELASSASVLYESFEKKNSSPDDPLAQVSARPDFTVLVYPGPTPFAAGRVPPPVPHDVPPSFVISAASDDQVHAVWADEYFAVMLAHHVPNIEMHLYANGRHPGDPMPNGSRMSGGLTDRNGTPFGAWQMRFIDWFRDLGYLHKPASQPGSSNPPSTHSPTAPH